MLKAQIAPATLPLGCHWIAAPHPLETRIANLKQPAVGDIRRLAGAWATALLAIGWGYAAWAAQPASPPRPHFVQTIFTESGTHLRSGVVMIRLSPSQVADMTRASTRD